MRRAAAFIRFQLMGDHQAMQILLDVVSAAELLTSPSGQSVEPEDRVAEILTRYLAGDPVHKGRLTLGTCSDRDGSSSAWLTGGSCGATRRR